MPGKIVLVQGGLTFGTGSRLLVQFLVAIMPVTEELLASRRGYVPKRPAEELVSGLFSKRVLPKRPRVITLPASATHV